MLNASPENETTSCIRAIFNWETAYCSARGTENESGNTLKKTKNVTEHVFLSQSKIVIVKVAQVFSHFLPQHNDYDN